METITVTETRVPVRATMLGGGCVQASRTSYIISLARREGYAVVNLVLSWASWPGLVLRCVTMAQTHCHTSGS